MSKLTVPAPLEIEAKLLLADETVLRAVARLDRLGAYTLRPRGTVRLQSQYLDTRALTLARHGVALRLRRCARRWEVTAKWAGEVNGALHSRPELTIALPTPPRMPFALPDGPLRVHLNALVAGRPLMPILNSYIQRCRLAVFAAAAPEAADDAEPTAELVLDRVRLAAPDEPRAAVATYCEAEIELLHGGRDDVEELTHALQRGFDLQPSTDSKLARGLKLLYETERLTSARSVRLRAAEPLEEAVRKITRIHLRRLRQADPGTRLGEDPEALHDFRVAVRRLRAAVKVFAGGFPSRLQSYLTDELAWLGGCSSGMRDLDVQLEKLAKYRSTVATDQLIVLEAIEAHLTAERARRRTAMLAAIDSGRYFRLLVRLEHFADAPARRRPAPAEAGEPLARAARRALKRALGRLRKRVRESGEAPSAEDLHALRIRAKRLRYVLEFLAALTGKRGRRSVRRLTRLQDLLGNHRDAVVAAAAIRQYAHDLGAQAPNTTLLVLGALVGHEERLATKARAAFHTAWRRFSRKHGEKELRAILRRLERAAPDARPEQPSFPPHRAAARMRVLQRHAL